MNSIIKQKWIAALESGEYGKTCHSLKDGSGYCCLGVLADLFHKETNKGEWDWGFDTFEFNGESYGEFPPVAVCEWAGLNTVEDSKQPFKTKEGHRDTLVDLNDLNDTFDEVIEAIKAYF